MCDWKEIRLNEHSKIKTMVQENLIKLFTNNKMRAQLKPNTPIVPWNCLSMLTHIEPMKCVCVCVYVWDVFIPIKPKQTQISLKPSSNNFQ